MTIEIEKLKDIIQDSNINFLVGSGMSVPFLGTLWNIETLLTELEYFKELLHLSVEQYDLLRASIYKKYFDVAIEKNVMILNNDTSVVPVLENYKDFFMNMNLLMLKRRNKLLSKQVNIFTTNIDVFLEKSVEEKGFEYNDGFNGRFKPKFDLSNFKKSFSKKSLHYENSSEIPVFNIMKVHGSLTWTIEGVSSNKEIICDTVLQQVNNVISAKPDDVSLFMDIEANDDITALCEKFPTPIDNTQIMRFIDEYQKLAIVNPTKDKFRDTILNQTYYELLRIYSNELEKENTVLFVMGFSFADEHIKELTLRVANSNPTLLVIIYAHTNDAKSIIETNINLTRVKNNNIIIEAPEQTEDPAGTFTDKFKYDFHTINSTIFSKVLKKIENPDE